MIAEIEKFGGSVAVDEKSPDKPVLEVYLRETKVTDAGLACLQGLNRLRSLNLAATRVTDTDWQASKGSPNSRSWTWGPRRSRTPG